MSNQYQQGLAEDTPQPSESELQILQGQPVFVQQAHPYVAQVQGQPIYQQPSQPIYQQPIYQPPIQQQYYQGQPNYLPQQQLPINPQWQQNYQYQQGPLPITAEGMEYPINIQCPHCNQQSNTYIEYKMSVYSWLMIVLLFILFIPLVWLPLFMRTQKNKIHRCNKCRNIVGKTKFRPC